MKQNILIIGLFFSLLFGCKPNSTKSNVSSLNLELSKQIDKMANLDKQMQLNMLQFSNGLDDQLAKVESLRNEVYKKHAAEIENILDTYGYPSYELVGKKSTDNFFTLIQHTTDYPEVKKKSIELMKQKLDLGQLEKYQYITLVDQYQAEQNLESSFGTIVQYDEKGKAYVERPAPDIDANRISMGLDSIDIFLMRATVEYFRMNRDLLKQRGITEPQLK